MPLKISRDFQYGKWNKKPRFSSKDAGWVFIENLHFGKNGERLSPLRMVDHVDLMQEIMSLQGSNCLWLVESASDKAACLLERKFPSHKKSGCSYSGYFRPECEMLQIFWNTHAKLDACEPWNHEEPWAVVGVTGEILSPTPTIAKTEKAACTLDHLFQHHDKMSSIFVQAGWFGYLGVKQSAGSLRLLARAFPDLFSGREHQSS